MDNEIRTFDDLYRNRYKDNITDDKERSKLVGELMVRALQNDDEAVSKIIELTIDPSFAVVKNALFKLGNQFLSLSLLEDLMQEITELIKKIFFRGIPQKVREEDLLGYLLGAVQKSSYQKLQKLSSIEKRKVYIDDERHDENNSNPGVTKLVDKKRNESEESRNIKGEMITYFIECLMNTEAEPHKAISYCYASLLPMILKSTQNEEILKRMDQMSGRGYKNKSSSFEWNERMERFEITGEISRDSDILMKWAMDAMWGMTVDFLQKEVQETYNIDPLGFTTFSWGQLFRENLLKNYDETKKEKDVVITSEFPEVTIKNWPKRLGESLYRKTREHFMKNEYYQLLASRYGRTEEAQ